MLINIDAGVAFTLGTFLRIKIYPHKFCTDRLHLNYAGYISVRLGFPFTREKSEESILC